MDSFENIWQKHLYIEYRLGKTKNGDSIMINENAWKNRLWEEHGIMPNMDSYIDCIVRYVQNFFQKNSFGQYNFVETKGIFNFPTFFDAYEIHFNINYDESVKSTRYGGSYVSGTSGWIKNKYKIVIKLSVESSNINDILYCVKKTSAHELTHAYDDFSRQRVIQNKYGRKQSGDSLFMNGRKKGTYNVDKFENDENEYISALSDILYRTNDAEINAAIAEFREEIKPLLIGTYSSKDAMNAIKKTRTYAYLETTLNNLEAFIFVGENPEYFKDLQDKLLNMLNNIRTHEDWEKLFLNIKKDDYFTNYNQLIKYIKKRVYRYQRKIISQTSKIAYDLFCKVGDKGTDYGIINQL